MHPAEAMSQRIKQPRREADQSSAFNDQVKNTWRCASISPYIFIQKCQKSAQNTIVLNGSDLRITFREPLKNTVLHTWMNVLHSVKVKVKVKQSLHNPGQALGVAGSWGSQILRQSAREGGKVVSPTHRPPLPPRKYSWYSFLLEAKSTPGP